MVQYTYPQPYWESWKQISFNTTQQTAFLTIDSILVINSNDDVNITIDIFSKFHQSLQQNLKEKPITISMVPNINHFLVCFSIYMQVYIIISDILINID